MLLKDVDHKVGTGRAVGLQLQVQFATGARWTSITGVSQSDGVGGLLNDFDLVERRASVA